MKAALVTAAVHLLLAAAAWGQGQVSAQSVSETLPPRVRDLVSLTDLDVPAEILRSDREWLIPAKREAVVRWIDRIIDEKFLPEARHELKDRVELWTQQDKGSKVFDVARVKWWQNGWRIAVMQTASTFVAILDRESSQAGPPGSETVKQVARQFLRDHTEVRVPGGTMLLTGGIRLVLITKSFSPTSVKSCNDGLVGMPERINWDDPEDCRTDNQWWRQIGWWQRGKQIGFFTVKAQAGQVQVTYGALDKGWFSPGPRSKTDTRPSVPPRDYAVSPPKDLADALRQFREERPRVAAARMIEPLIKIGMDRKEVGELLGPPTKDRDGEWWVYGLREYWSLFFEDSKLLAFRSTLRPKPSTRPQAGESTAPQP